MFLAIIPLHQGHWMLMADIANVAMIWATVVVVVVVGCYGGKWDCSTIHMHAKIRAMVACVRKLIIFEGLLTVVTIV